jgi:hypothetical protein
MSPIHLAHATLANKRQDLVGAEFVAFGESHVSGSDKFIP